MGGYRCIEGYQQAKVVRGAWAGESLSEKVVPVIMPFLQSGEDASAIYLLYEIPSECPVAYNLRH